MNEWFCNVRRSDWGGSVRIYLGFKKDDKMYMIRNNTAEEFNPLEAQQTPTLEFTEECQEDSSILTHLIDGLIKCGIKPTVKLPDTTELTAVKYHLEDMRKIVFELRPTD